MDIASGTMDAPLLEQGPDGQQFCYRSSGKIRWSHLVPQGNPAGIESFEDVLKADIIGIEKYQAFRWDSIQKRYSRIWESGIRWSQSEFWVLM